MLLILFWEFREAKINTDVITVVCIRCGLVISGTFSRKPYWLTPPTWFSLVNLVVAFLASFKRYISFISASSESLNCCVSVLNLSEWPGDPVRMARCWKSRRPRASGSCMASCCSSSTLTSTLNGQNRRKHYTWCLHNVEAQCKI